jgi:hypothetical protein
MTTKPPIRYLAERPIAPDNELSYGGEALVPNNRPVIFVTQPILPEGLEILRQAGEVRQNDWDRQLTEDEMVEIGITLEPETYVGTFAEPHRVFSARVIEASRNLKVIAWNGLATTTSASTQRRSGGST